MWCNNEWDFAYKEMISKSSPVLRRSFPTSASTATTMCSSSCSSSEPAMTRLPLLTATSDDGSSASSVSTTQRNMETMCLSDGTSSSPRTNNHKRKLSQAMLVKLDETIDDAGIYRADSDCCGEVSGNRIESRKRSSLHRRWHSLCNGDTCGEVFVRQSALRESDVSATSVCDIDSQFGGKKPDEESLVEKPVNCQRVSSDGEEASASASSIIDLPAGNSSSGSGEQLQPHLSISSEAKPSRGYPITVTDVRTWHAIHPNGILSVARSRSSPSSPQEDVCCRK